jgi:ribosomal protein L32
VPTRRFSVARGRPRLLLALALPTALTAAHLVDCPDFQGKIS